MMKQETPRSNRLHIGIFGKRNSGKSSLLNALTGQKVSIVSDVAGTTTDTVLKNMEVHGLGACVWVDTAGFDDEGELGMMRVERSQKAASMVDAALLVVDATRCDLPDECLCSQWQQECEWMRLLVKRNVVVIPVLTKTENMDAQHLLHLQHLFSQCLCCAVAGEDESFTSADGEDATSTSCASSSTSALVEGSSTSMEGGTETTTSSTSSSTSTLGGTEATTSSTSSSTSTLGGAEASTSSTSASMDGETASTSCASTHGEDEATTSSTSSSTSTLGGAEASTSSTSVSMDGETASTSCASTHGEGEATTSSTTTDGEAEAISKMKVFTVSSAEHQGIDELRKALVERLVEKDEVTDITGSLAKDGDVVVLVMPQDIQAPKGRLILPQVQTIRNLLDKKCITVCCTTNALAATLQQLKQAPSLIITDSQAFREVAPLCPSATRLTSFSVLFARYKGDVHRFMVGARAIQMLTPQSRVLIAEACTHAPLAEDIGRVKLPALLRKRVGQDLRIDLVAGNDFPTDLTPYNLVIHCGACMFTRRHVLNRLAQAEQQGVHMTNYGIALAQLMGILNQVSVPE